MEAVQQIGQTDLNEKQKQKQKFKICVIDAGNVTVSKVFSVKDGDLHKAPSSFPATFDFEVVEVDGAQGLDDLIDGLSHSQAIVTGLPHVKRQPDKILTKGKVVTKSKYAQLEKSGADLTGTISRSKDCFIDGNLLPFDIDGGAVKFNQIQERIYQISPELKGAPMLVKGSSSYGLEVAGKAYIQDTINAHAYVLVEGGIDQLSRVKEPLQYRCWNLGIDARIVISKSGDMLVRQFTDEAVFSSERIIYVAPPVLEEGVVRHVEAPKIIDEGNGEVFKLSSIPDMSTSDKEKALSLIAVARREAVPEAKRISAKDTENKVKQAIDNGSDPVQTRKDIIASKRDGVLYPSQMVRFDEHGWLTVEDLLGDPIKYDGATGSDPLEPDYNGGRNIAVFYANLNEDTGEFNPIINTRAHGGRNYRLREAPIESPTSDEIYNLLAAQLGVDADTIRQLGLINEAVVERIFKGSWFNPSTKHVYFLNVHHELLSLVVADVIKALPRAFGAIYNKSVMNDLLEEYKEATTQDFTGPQWAKFTANLKSLPINTTIELLKFNNQRKQLEYTVDPFTNEGHIKLLPNKVNVVLPMPAISYKANGVDDQTRKEVIADYAEHFQNLYKFLDFIVAARFAPDRKNASVWFHADSDWGKNFLVDAFKKIGTSVELSMKELEKMFEGAPVGRTAEEFIYSFVAFFDEVKTIKAEAKQISNKAMLSAKFESTCSVDMFAKVYLSAEMINSLAGEQGVEGQFANRISYFRLKGSIKHREVFLRVGNGLYHNIVTEHLAEQLQQRIEAYIAKGRTTAAKDATQQLDRFHKEFNLLNTFESIDSRVDEIADDIKVLINDYVHAVRTSMGGREYVSSNCPRSIGPLLDDLLIFCESSNNRKCEDIVLKSYTKFINAYIEHVADFSGKVSLTYKSAAIAEKLGEKGRHRLFSGNNVNGLFVQHRGLLLDMS